MRSAVQSQSGTEQSWRTRIDNLRKELRFHQLRSLKERLQRLYDGRYGSLHESLKQLGDLRDIAGELRDCLNFRLDRRLEKDLPPLADEMTEVYLRLTERPMFNSIRIHQGDASDGSMTLDLKVASARGGETLWGVDSGVLNGQALNAIQLVPYFVFSRYQEDPLLDLLLLDDPTQAFDTRKIELLLKELSDASSHATVMVATHEEDRFLPLLQRYFSPDEVKAFRTVDLDENGPRLENVSITI